MRLPFLLAALMLAPALNAQDFAGTWSGPLQFPGGTLEFVLHVEPDGDGYTATADSPLQESFGIPVALSVDGETLTATIEAVGASFSGTREGDALVGTFTQGANEIPATLTRQTAPSGDLAALVGDWEGDIADVLPVVLHLRPGPEADRLGATLDSPSQDSFGNPSEGATLTDGTLTIVFPDLGGQYEAEVRGDSLVGTWTQGGQSLPLVMTRAMAEETGSNEVRRPQTPQGPFPYRQEEVRVESAPGVTLAGTLLVPEGAGPFQAVVFITGSGPQDRDETLLGHKPFALLADRLARAGVASYRFDDRGTAESTGDWASSTIADFATDAGAALRAVLARDEIASVGLVGHSEGGYVAPRVAREVPEAAFVVLLAGPGVAGAEVYAEQHRLIAMARGLPEASAEVYGRMIAALTAPYADPTRTDDARRAEAEAAARQVLADADPALVQPITLGQDPQPTFDVILDFISTPGIGSFMAWDPTDDLRALRVPALAVFAALDLQVPPAQSAAAMEAALGASASPAYAVVTLDGLNHLFQPTETGNTNEYGEIETTMSEEVLDLVARWIVGVTT